MSQVENGSDKKEQGFLKRTGNKIRSLGAAAARGWSDFWSDGDKVAPENKAKPSIPSTDNEKPADAPVAKLTLEELVANYNEAVIGGADKDVLLKMTDEIDALAEERKKFPLDPVVAVMNYEQAIQAKDAIGENAIAKFGAVAENAFFLSEKRGEKIAEDDIKKFKSLLGSLGLNDSVKQEDSVPQREQEVPENYRSEKFNQSKETEFTERSKEKTKTDSKKLDPKKSETSVMDNPTSSEDKDKSPFDDMTDDELVEEFWAAFKAGDTERVDQIESERSGRIDKMMADFRAKAKEYKDPRARDHMLKLADDLEGNITEARARVEAAKRQSDNKPKGFKEPFKRGYRRGRQEASTRRIRPIKDEIKPSRPNKPKQSRPSSDRGGQRPGQKSRPRTSDRTRL